MSGDYRRLYRSRKDRMIVGVCGGLGEYFNVDPTIIRVLFVALVVLGVGSGLLIYIIMAIIMPEKPLDYAPPAPAAPEPPAAVKTEETEADLKPTDEAT
jgi:phage shock protein C